MCLIIGLSVLVEDFHEIMPLLRRTFAEFSESAKNVLSRRSAGRPAKASDLVVQVGQDGNPADGVFEYLEKILGT